ncbi:hypothetical protein [Kitasatospora sp. NPDC048407]|uniref:hypothetical protein n=1 Tax=Kitasatospora sp. NPDC048407 TaxID=3364051 RepID=UPI0037144699
MRFLIVGERDDEDAIGVDLLLGRCAAVEGLFADPPPPPREILALPGSAAREVWRQWQPGPPQQPGSWRGLSVAAKEEWQSPALDRRDPEPDRSGGEYHLAGAGVEDETGLHCALGEAINGPGGYYGRESMGFADCLGGGFGAVPPFTLVRHDFAAIFAATERELAEETDLPAGRSCPEFLARAMEYRKVRVVRA